MMSDERWAVPSTRMGSSSNFVLTLDRLLLQLQFHGECVSCNLGGLEIFSISDVILVYILLILNRCCTTNLSCTQVLDKIGDSECSIRTALSVVTRFESQNGAERRRAGLKRSMAGFSFNSA